MNAPIRKLSGFLALAFAVGFSLSAGCAGALPGAARAQIESGNADLAMALSQGRAGAVAALYTGDARMFPPNSDVVSGREAIQRFWQGAIDAGVRGLALTTMEIEEHGDSAHEVGKYSATGDGGKVLDTGKYVVIWKREQGRWHLHRDIWNTSMPAPAR
jgi:ketosteroid isomerase-like protein